MVAPKNFSLKKPAVKVSFPTPSISSTTTPKKASEKKANRQRAAVKKSSVKKAPPRSRPLEPVKASMPSIGGDLIPLDSETRTLGSAEKRQYLRLLSQGASPAAACLKLGYNTADLAFTFESDRRFFRQSTQVKELLSQNVAAALYRSAMEGSVSAQTFFLKNCPPPDWPEDHPVPIAKPLEELTDEELIKKFRETAPDLLAQLSSEASESKSAAGSCGVSQES